MFRNKVIVVTGGANGIGRCIAESFAAQHARVVVIDRDVLAGERLIQRLGPDHLFIPGDLSDRAFLESACTQLLARYGGIDFLINNAYVTHAGLLSGCSFEDFNTTLAVCVTAPYYLTLLLKDHLRPGASIVNIASTRAFMSQRDTESYTAAKGAIVALTHGLANSLAGIARVNSVAPGWIDTSAWQEAHVQPTEHSAADRLQHPARRIGKPEDIARTVLFLCAPDADFITGENITVDGGMTKRMIYHNDEGWTYSAK